MIKTETIVTMNDEDFDKLLHRHYGVVYEFVPEQEAHNGADYRFNVSDADLNNIPNDEDLSKLKHPYGSEKRRGCKVYPDELLNLLVKDGHLPKGNFLIEVFW